jgi:hypothetical protein
MILSLDVRKARKGDCLILHYGTRNDPGLAVIDGGPANVYTPQLKPRFAQIRAARGMAAGDTLPVDLLMVSHIDDDHIRGVLELTSELVIAADEHRPLPLKIRDLWHNTFDDALDKSPQELMAAVTAAFGAASIEAVPDVDGIDPDAAMVLASIPQGIRLRDDARRLNLRLNSELHGHLIMAAAGAPSLDMGKGLSFTVAGPLKTDLVALQHAHDDFLRKQRDVQRTPAALASFTDDSIPNLSSLVILAESQGLRILLTGDARGDKILTGLERAGALAPGGRLNVAVLKMPHHGSDRNVAPAFFDRVVADHYVFSGDGEHGNPERATLEMLLQARGDSAYTVHLTYPVDQIDVERKKDWEKEQQKEEDRQRKNPNVVVRPDWSPAANGLSAFLADHPAFAQKIRVVEDGEAHVIDMLDPLGF